MIVAQEQAYYPEKQYQPVKRYRTYRLPRHRQIVLTGLVLLGFFIGLLIVFFYAQMVATGYRIHKVEKEVDALYMATERLNEELANLTSLERVEMVATTRLGMVEPESKMVLVQSNSGEESSSFSEGRGTGSTGTVAYQPWKEEKKHSWIIQALVNLVYRQEHKNSG